MSESAFAPTPDHTCPRVHATKPTGLTTAIDWRPISGRAGLHVQATTCATCDIYVFQVVVIGGQWAILREHLTTLELHLSPFYSQVGAASLWDDLLDGRAS